MLLFCTKDTALIEAWDQSAGWGAVVGITPDFDQYDAESAFQSILTELAPGEALCIAAYGSDGAIGDQSSDPAPWSFGADAIASFLNNAGLSNGVSGGWKAAQTEGAGALVLFQLVSAEPLGFSALVAEGLNSDAQGPFSITTYGYKTPVDLTVPVPEPATLAADTTTFLAVVAS